MVPVTEVGILEWYKLQQFRQRLCNGVTSVLTTLVASLSSLPRLRPQSVTCKVNVVSRLVLRSTVYCPPVLNWLNVPCVP